MTQLSVGLVEAEQMTGLSKHTWRRMVKDGRVRAARVGRRILIPMSELERMTKPGATTQSKSEE
jgi:excisionase family DNA binding protein